MELLLQQELEVALLRRELEGLQVEVQVLKVRQELEGKLLLQKAEEARDGAADALSEAGGGAAAAAGAGVGPGGAAAAAAASHGRGLCGMLITIARCRLVDISALITPLCLSGETQEELGAAAAAAVTAALQCQCRTLSSSGVQRVVLPHKQTKLRFL